MYGSRKRKHTEISNEVIEVSWGKVHLPVNRTINSVEDWINLVAPHFLKHSNSEQAKVELSAAFHSNSYANARADLAKFTQMDEQAFESLLQSKLDSIISRYEKFNYAEIQQKNRVKNFSLSRKVAKKVLKKVKQNDAEDQVLTALYYSSTRKQIKAQQVRSRADQEAKFSLNSDGTHVVQRPSTNHKKKKIMYGVSAPVALSVNELQKQARVKRRNIFADSDTQDYFILKHSHGPKSPLIIDDETEGIYV